MVYHHGTFCISPHDLLHLFLTATLCPDTITRGEFQEGCSFYKFAVCGVRCNDKVLTVHMQCTEEGYWNDQYPCSGEHNFVYRSVIFEALWWLSRICIASHLKYTVCNGYPVTFPMQIYITTVKSDMNYALNGRIKHYFKLVSKLVAMKTILYTYVNE